MIDLTLDEILIPDITGYINPYNFGTKITSTETNKGGLSSREVNNNILAPFAKMRAVTVNQTESTSDVEYDAKIVIDASNSIEFTLGNATYTGCTVTIVNKNNINHTLLCSSVSQQHNDILIGNSEVELMWNGTAWKNISAPAVGKKIEQYPQEKAPGTIYPCTEWQEINYNGAFFRSAGGNAAAFVEHGNTLPSPQSQGTAQYTVSDADNISFTGVASEVSTVDPSWDIEYSGDNHSHTYYSKYAKTGSSIATRHVLYVDAKSDAKNTNYNITTDEETTSISGTITGDHTHTFTPSGTITAPDGSETRPKNFTMKVWERIA